MGKHTLFVMIPSLNEAKTIGNVIKSVPRKITGIDTVKVLVINDGSTDSTAKVAKAAGADFIVEHSETLGLATSFADGLQFALSNGATIIVNTDADNQYNQTEIPKLVQPILNNKADVVIGDRHVKKLTHMPLTKKWGNIIGTWLLGLLLRQPITDASSGFRAFSAKAAKSFTLTSSHTYTHETLIQAYKNKLRVLYVPIEFRPRANGDSRLIASLPKHITRSTVVILRNMLK